MNDIRIYLLQRITAIIMIPLVLGHLALMIFAIQDGLSAQEILSRTRGSLFWGIYYGLFVLAAAIHGTIGVRAIISEWFGLGRTILNLFSWVMVLLLIALGMNAVIAVTV